MNLHEAVSGQLNQAQLDAQVTPKNYRTIDWDTFKHLEGNAIRLPNGLAPSISAVAYLSGYTESGGALFDFPLNDAGLPWVEAYLTRMVKPYIRRWGKKSNGLEVLDSVVPEYDSAWIGDDPLVRTNCQFHIASTVMGQCIAQQHGLKWTPDGQGIALANGEVFNVWAKPRKFCRFGKEDSIVAVSTFIANWKVNRQLTDMAFKSLDEQGVKLPNGYIAQPWHREDGRLIAIKILDRKNRKVLHHIGLANLEEMSPEERTVVEKILAEKSAIDLGEVSNARS